MHSTTQPSYKSLRSLGYRLFGPVVAPFALAVAEEIHSLSGPAVFLMREGFHLSKLVDHVLEKQERHESRGRIKTLVVSRAFLFKLMLGDARLVASALEHSYVGSLEGLLRDRFSLTESEMRSIGRVPALSLKLPEQRLEELPALISRLTTALHPLIAEKRALYSDYFRGITQNQPLQCVDIGFAASTQRALAALMGCRSHGLYMYLSRKFKPTANVTARGLISSSAAHGDGDPLIDCSLVLESVFTSPEGQLRDVECEGSGRIKFVYGRHTRVQDDFHCTYAVVDGIRDFIDQMMKHGIEPEEMASLLDRGLIYLSQLRYDQSAEMKKLRSIAQVDDQISGLEVLNPFTSLPSLAGAA